MGNFALSKLIKKKKMNSQTIVSLQPSSSCRNIFLKMGILLENSPTANVFLIISSTILLTKVHISKT